MAGLVDADGGLDFGTGLAWLTSGIGQAGLTITTSTSGAALFLALYGPYGMVMDFEDASIAIANSGGSLNYQSQGDFSAAGAPLGPLSKLTYSAPSVKMTEQSDGYLGFQAHNLCLQSETFTSASWSKSGVASTSADTITVSAGSSGHFVFQNITAVSGATYTAEVELRSGTYRYVSLQVSDNVANGVGRVLDLQTGLITADITLGTLYTIVGAPTVTDEGGGYYKISITYTNGAPGTTTVFAIFARPDGTSTTWSPSWSAVGTETFQVRKAHLRRTPSVDTYVATTSAAVYDLPYVYSGGELQSILPEPAATNLALQSNDFTNASWTKSNMTTALTATGPDGVANSASTLTATAANATALQAITSASSSRLTSVYIKRRTGSGNIDLTQDNGTTWTTQTVTSSWTRVALSAVTSTNPTVGIRIVTSGDAVDVWCFQHETGTVATSPIITYGAAVARAADSPLALLNLFPSIGTAYTVYAKYKPQSASVATTAIRLDDTTTNELVSLGNNASGAGLATVTDGGVSQASITSGTITASAFHRVAASVEANNVLFVVNGGAGVQDTSVTLPTLTRLLLTAGGGQELQQIAILPGARTEAQLQALGA